MSKLPIFEQFLSVRNLKPKLEWFFKPKLEPKMFLLNWVPGRPLRGHDRQLLEHLLPLRGDVLELLLLLVLLLPRGLSRGHPRPRDLGPPPPIGEGEVPRARGPPEADSRPGGPIK